MRTLYPFRFVLVCFGVRASQQAGLLCIGRAQRLAGANGNALGSCALCKCASTRRIIQCTRADNKLPFIAAQVFRGRIADAVFMRICMERDWE